MFCKTGFTAVNHNTNVWNCISGGYVSGKKLGPVWISESLKRNRPVTLSLSKGRAQRPARHASTGSAWHLFGFRSWACVIPLLRGEVCVSLRLVNAFSASLVWLPMGGGWLVLCWVTSQPLHTQLHNTRLAPIERAPPVGEVILRLTKFLKLRKSDGQYVWRWWSLTLPKTKSMDRLSYRGDI